MSSQVATAPGTRGSGISLGNGRRITVRPITSADAGDLRDFYRGLSSDARHARFLGMAASLADGVVSRFACVDHVRADGLVAELHERGPEDGRIVGHLCLEPDGAGSNELAVAVADGYRGLGIGTALMAGALASAHLRGVHRLTATMLATNLPMRRLMLHAGLPAASDELDAGVEAIALEMAA
jgi:acetyltransferase